MKILLSVLLLVAVGAGAWIAFSGPSVEPSLTPPPERVAPEQPQPTQPEVTTADPTRVEAPVETTRTVAETATAPDAAQGVRGRVLLPGGGPAGGVKLYLMKSSTADPLTIFLHHKKGLKMPPTAEGVTAADGRFTIGINEADQTFDLRVVSDNHPEMQHKSIKVRGGDWYVTPDLVLSMGGVVQGHVVDEQGKFPVANARVFLTVPALNYQMLPTPGRERGIETVTDGSGYFRYTCAPADGVITLGAEAADYAYSEKANLQLKQDATNDFTIEVARGERIAGVVVDVNGKPIIGAQLTATAQSAKLPQTANATSGSDGRFELPLLRPGPYQVVASANNYEDATEKPVFTGNVEVKLVLEQRGKVRLRVLSARGQPVREYTVSLKRYFPNNPGTIGKVPEFADVRISPRDYDGDYANVKGVPNGDFVLQILEPRHAKTLSQPFTMAAGKEPPVVEVTLTNGASITGLVVDDRGQPVAEANVGSDMNGGLAIEGGFGALFKNFLPDKHTTKTTKTDGGGRFVLNQLAFADYMIRVSHPDFCEGTAVDLKLDTEGQMKDIGIITLSRGCTISGVCSYGGNPSGQIKVTLTLPDGYKPELDKNGQPQQPRFFSVTAISDGDGRYHFLKRVPPGQYKIYAFREAGQEEVFSRFKQLKDTQVALTINPGQDQLEVNFNVPAQ